MNKADLIAENAQLKNQIKDNAIMHVKEMNKLLKQLKTAHQDEDILLGHDSDNDIDIDIDNEEHH